MNKELFVTSTPHETKVGLVEDDQLAEIYLEREGEYTLAGSIYKGRVTRVLPGMQSAFVDIGLERDAFLYVSDFLELEDQGDGDEEIVPAHPMPAEGSEADGEPADYDSYPVGASSEGGEGLAGENRAPRESSAPRSYESRSNGGNRDRYAGGRGGRGGRRRGGRRDSEHRSVEPRGSEPRSSESRSSEPRSFEPAGESRISESRTSESRSSESRSSESRFSEPKFSEARTSRPREAAAEEFGPPAGYQPMILPGESLSKYKNRPAASFSAPSRRTAEPTAALASNFPDDEPAFAMTEEAKAAAVRAQEAASETKTEATVRESAQVNLVAPVAESEASAVVVANPDDQADGYAVHEETVSQQAHVVETEVWEAVAVERHEDVIVAIPAIVEGPKPRRRRGSAAVAAPPMAAAPVEEHVEEHIEVQEIEVREEVRHVSEPMVQEQVQEEHGQNDPRESRAAEPLTYESVLEESVVQEPVVEEPVHAARETQAQEPLSFYSGSTAGVIEEQEIDEDETELAAYAEHVPEHGNYEELEEETRVQSAFVSAEGRVHDDLHELAEVPMGAAELAEEFQMEQQQEAELEQIQEEAEAQAAGDYRGEPAGTRAEVRAPAATAAFMQRTQRNERGGERGGSPRRGRPQRSGGNSGASRFRRHDGPTPQIADLLKAGQEVLIQIAKEPIAKKGARITSHIALPGRFLVYMPTVNHVGVSRKISSDEERMRLKRIVISERENGVGGFIVRTAAGGAAEDELRADIRFLKSLWHEIKTRAETSKAPALIYHDLNVVERVLRDQVTSDFSQIWVDNETEYERVLRFAQRFQPSLMKRIKLYTKDIPLFEQFGLQEEMNKALKSKVWLKSGGYIVINQTEALVAIDVNTGKYVGKTTRLEDTIVKTNVDAIKEIVRQIRLRDLGGIIIIDFIDMDERRNRQKVMQVLEEELRADRAPSKVLSFNDFGLVAITRKRVKQSLERTIGAPCPYCVATGYVKSAATVCNEIYVEMRKMGNKANAQGDMMLRVNPEVAKVLKGQNGKWLLEMEELTKRTIIIKSDASLHQEQFDVN